MSQTAVARFRPSSHWFAIVSGFCGCFRQLPVAAERSGGLAMICLRGTMIPPLDSDPELDFQPFLDPVKSRIITRTEVL